MERKTAELVAPSGRRVRLEWTDEASLSSRAAGIRFAGGSYGRGFQVGPRGHHDFAAKHMLPATLRYRTVVRNREVLVSEANDKSATVATLVGRHHELMTVFAGPAPSRTRLTDLFGALDVDDQPEGMRVMPRSATLVTMVTEHVVAVVGGRGSIDVPGVAQAQKLIPTWEGAKTAHGELWRTPLPGPAGRSRADGARDYSYVLGCPRGVAEIHLDPAESVPDAELLRWVDTVKVSWQGAKPRSGR
jgi:hypothetical protein